MNLATPRAQAFSQSGSRKLCAGTFLNLAFLAGLACSVSAQTPQAAARKPLQYITVDDPGFGIPRGTMPFFVNWRGTATVDRKDNMSDPVDAYEFTSPDGSASIRQIGKTVVTTVLPAMARNYPGVQLMKFQSSADLLMRVVLPQLQLGGHPEDPVAASPNGLAILSQGMPASGFVDAATVKVDNIAGGKEVLVRAITAGHYRGQPGENSSTTIMIFTAPAARVQALVSAFRDLPPYIVNPEWMRRQYDKDLRGQQQSAQQIADFNRKQAAFNATQAAINDMHRTATAAASNRTAADLARQRQDQQDGAAVHIGILAGETAYFKWCSPDGLSYQVTDSTFPPASSWKRCN